MNGKCEGPKSSADDDEEVDSEEGPMPVDEFFALPSFHPRKIAVYREMMNLDEDGSDEDS